MLGRFSEDLTALQRAIRFGDGDALFDLFTRTRAIRRGIIEAGQETAAPDFGRPHDGEKSELERDARQIELDRADAGAAALDLQRELARRLPVEGRRLAEGEKPAGRRALPIFRQASAASAAMKAGNASAPAILKTRFPSTIPSPSTVISPSALNRAPPLSSAMLMPRAAIGACMPARPARSARGGTESSPETIPVNGGSSFPAIERRRSAKANVARCRRSRRAQANLARFPP